MSDVHVRPAFDKSGRYMVDQYGGNGAWSCSGYYPTKKKAQKAAKAIRRNLRRK